MLHPKTIAKALVALALGVATSGCASNPLQGSLTQNVGNSFAPCSEAEIRLLATKHNMQTAFRPCGNNNFNEFAWSPDGKLLYFQLVMTGFVMDASVSTKDTQPIPTQSPIGPAVWLSATKLAVPVGPALPDPAKPDQVQKAPRMALFDTAGRSVFYADLPEDLHEIEDLSKAENGLILFTARDKTNKRKVWTHNTNTGETTSALPWLTTPVDTMTYTRKRDVVVIGHDNKVTMYQAKDGTVLGSWAPASRGSLHHDGKWIMLEHLGQPISIFYQRSWDELSERARERELRRAKEFEDSLPPSTPREVQPPTLSFASTQTGERYMLSSVYGSSFSWYEPTDFYGSFISWGFEGKQYKRNVLLGQFLYRMQNMERGKDFLGVSKFGKEEGATFTPGTEKVPLAPPPAPTVKQDEPAASPAVKQE